MEEDPFDQILRLEDEYYRQGFQLGQEEGRKAGLIEGKLFGVERGYEKFVQLGKLHARSVVWASRIPRIENQKQVNTAQETMKSKEDRYEPLLNLEKLAIDKSPSSGEAAVANPQPALQPLLPNTSRLEKHVRMLFALTEPETFSTENNEDAVSDFDDRFKRAVARAMIIGRIVGEESGVTAPSALTPSLNDDEAVMASHENASIEDVNVLLARH